MANGIVEIFKEIPDPRSGNALKYKLEEILTIAVLAVLSPILNGYHKRRNGKDLRESE